MLGAIWFTDAYLEGCNQGEAADRLADYLGLPGARSSKRPGHRGAGAPARRGFPCPGWHGTGAPGREGEPLAPVPVTPAPRSALAPNLRAPVERLAVRDDAGRMLLYVCRSTCRRVAAPRRSLHR